MSHRPTCLCRGPGGGCGSPPASRTDGAPGTCQLVQGSALDNLLHADLVPVAEKSNAQENVIKVHPCDAALNISKA